MSGGGGPASHREIYDGGGCVVSAWRGEGGGEYLTKRNPDVATQARYTAKICFVGVVFAVYVRVCGEGVPQPRGYRLRDLGNAEFATLT